MIVSARYLKILHIWLLLLAALSMSSCPERSAPDPEKQKPTGEHEEHSTAKEEVEAAPEKVDIGEDCVAFVRATTAVSKNNGDAECAECPVNTKEVLRVDNVRVDQISCAGDGCEAAVTIYATFNPSTSTPIAGGLVGWIPSNQREEYNRGKTPAGQQVYKVNVTYRRDGEFWRAVEFH